MSRRFRFLCTFALFVLIPSMSLQGCIFLKKCGELFAKEDQIAEKMMEHRSPLVSLPSIISYFGGITVGFFVGLPIEVLWLLPSAMIYDPHSNPENDEKEWIIYNQGPIVFSVVILSGTSLAVVGGPCWALFGWWWPGESKS